MALAATMHASTSSHISQLNRNFPGQKISTNQAKFTSNVHFQLSKSSAKRKIPSAVIGSASRLSVSFCFQDPTYSAYSLNYHVLVPGTLLFLLQIHFIINLLFPLEFRLHSLPLLHCFVYIVCTKIYGTRHVTSLCFAAVLSMCIGHSQIHTVDCTSGLT